MNKSKIKFHEIGSSGNYFLGGFSNYEYNTELNSYEKFIKYDEMKRGSAMARATLMSIILPLIGAKWIIRPYSRKRADIKQCEFIEYNLFKGMTKTWTSLLYEVLQMTCYGYVPFEKVWERSKNMPQWNLKGDYVVLKKIAPRHPATIYKFIFDDYGNLKKLVQNAYFNIGENSEFKFVDLPIEDLILFVNEQEGDNYEGISVFRSGYGHWRSIQTYYNIANIGIERMCVGYPCFEYPEDYWELSEQDRKACSDMFDDVIKNFRAHEHSGCKIPPRAKLHIIKGEFDSIALEKLISHHETKIAQAALATFLKIGETRVGSLALSRDQSDFFLRSLIALGNDVCGTFNKDLIVDMINKNFKQVDGYPEISVMDIGARDLKDFAETLRILTQSFLLTPDEEGTLEDDIRKIYDLPDRTNNQIIKNEKMIQEGQNVFSLHPANHYAYAAGVGQQSGITNPMSINKGVTPGTPPPNMNFKSPYDYSSIANKLEATNA